MIVVARVVAAVVVGIIVPHFVACVSYSFSLLLVATMVMVVTLMVMLLFLALNADQFQDMVWARNFGYRKTPLEEGIKPTTFYF